MKIENLKGPLMSLGAKFHNLGLELYFVSDKRTRATFEPDSFTDMISVYPQSIYNSIVLANDSVNADWAKCLHTPVAKIFGISHSMESLSNGAEWRYISENNLDEDFDNVAYDKITAYQNLPYGNRCLVVAIDEMYIDTLMAKLDVIDNIEERVANDICPYIFDYFETVANIIPILQASIKSSQTKFLLKSLITGDSGRGTTISSVGTPVVDGQYFTSDSSSFIKVMYMNLFIVEMMNDLTKGKMSQVLDIEHIFRHFITETITESKLSGHLMLQTLISTYVGKEKEGTAFHALLIAINNLTGKHVSGTDIEQFAFTCIRGFYEETGTMNKEQMLSSQYLRQYAETHEIMTALANTTNYNLFAESILGNKDDAEKDMSRVLDVARRASLAEIELQYINTKYSKKDAINNAYIVVQEIRNTFRKIKSNNARALLTDIEKNLVTNISKAKSFDHKKERMTINIAYPTGYAG